MKKIYVFATLLTLAGCGDKGMKTDAEGSFEADEVIVSAEMPGRILSFKVNEGDTIAQGEMVGQIDSQTLVLQRAQVQATIQALHERTSPLQPQIELLQNQLTVQGSQLDNLLHERDRTQRLLSQDAATGKQLDDLNAQIDVLRKQMNVTRQQMNVQRSNTGTQNRSVMSERAPLNEQVAQINEELTRSKIINPVSGTVLTKYAATGEMTAAGKALYKIADISYLDLRAYVTGDQLPQLKLGQQVQVLIDSGANHYRRYPGTITWISDKAEFTPKTIQTKDERANLVYAIKVRTKNDGYLKIGMYGELIFHP